MITNFYIPTKLISGAGSFKQLGAEAAAVGKRVLLVTGRSAVRKSGVLDRAIADLEKNGLSVVVFDRVEPNPRSTTVDEGAAVINAEKCDLVIALGGGSAIDAAKGMVIAAAGHKSVWHYVTTREAVSGKAAALITVPTVAASGSEANPGAVITNWETHDKCVVGDAVSWPKVSIIDPELTLTLPARPTAQGGVDIFCHVVEPYITSADPQPLTDGIQETVMQMVVTNLGRALEKPQDIEARSQLSWASTIACSDFAGLGGGGGSLTLHGMEHPLSGYYDMAHGDGLAALLPAWLESLADVRQVRLDKLGERVFGEKDGLAAVAKWLGRVGMGLHLRDLGVEKAMLGALAANSLVTAPWLAMHPKKLDAAAVEAIYQRAW